MRPLRRADRRQPQQVAGTNLRAHVCYRLVERATHVGCMRPALFGLPGSWLLRRGGVWRQGAWRARAQRHGLDGRRPCCRCQQRNKREAGGVGQPLIRGRAGDQALLQLLAWLQRSLLRGSRTAAQTGSRGPCGNSAHPGGSGLPSRRARGLPHAALAAQEDVLLASTAAWRWRILRAGRRSLVPPNACGSDLSRT